MNSDLSRSFLLQNSPAWRIALLVTLLFGETVSMTVRFDTGYLVNSYKSLMVMGYSGTLLKIALAMAGAFVVLSFFRFERIRALIRSYTCHNSGGYWLASHLVCLAFFVALTWFIFRYASQAGFLINFAVLIWFSGAAITLATLLLTAFPGQFWKDFLVQEKYTSGAAALIGLVAWFLGQELTYYSALLNEWTFQASYRILGLFFEQTLVDAESKLLGVSSFVVEIRRDCSGYEGIALVVVFLSVYLWLYRESLRFPHALLLFPIGILAMWTLNVVRIVVLISIGAIVSDRVALGGFHSNAGWLAFVATGLGLIWLFHRFAFFSSSGETSVAARGDGEGAGAATALILPFVALLATVLVTQAIVSDFDWFYPLRVVVCAAVLWQFRDYYRTIMAGLRLHAIAIGGLVFVLWTYLVPFSPEEDRSFALSLFSVEQELSALWLAFRCVGAVITVPLVEELLFRGYLINKLTGEKSFLRFGQFSFLSFAVSSLLFGFLHGEWLAGTLAGMCFAGALYVRKQLIDAVIAHMTTNALLAAYVMYSGHWSLW